MEQSGQTATDLVTHGYADLDGLRLHYVEAGSGPLVVLLHGFPDFWYTWRYQIPALVEAGFRIVAPDMRGYNLSDKPQGVSSYRTDLLADDVAQLIRVCGEERASVVGHDWGATVAWSFAMRHPEMLNRLVILNVPHPARMLRALRTWRQLRKSWYMFVFQLPWLPEAVMRASGYAVLRHMLRSDPVRPGAVGDDDIARYVEAASQPGALTAALNYYRALFRQGRQLDRGGMTRIDAPVLVIWGEQDRFLGEELARPDRDLVPNVRVELLPDASHWVHVDRPERVNELLIDFLQPTRGSM